MQCWKGFCNEIHSHTSFCFTQPAKAYGRKSSRADSAGPCRLQYVYSRLYRCMGGWICMYARISLDSTWRSNVDSSHGTHARTQHTNVALHSHSVLHQVGAQTLSRLIGDLTSCIGPLSMGRRRHNARRFRSRHACCDVSSQADRCSADCRVLPLHGCVGLHCDFCGCVHRLGGTASERRERAAAHFSFHIEE